MSVPQPIADPALVSAAAAVAQAAPQLGATGNDVLKGFFADLVSRLRGQTATLITVTAVINDVRQKAEQYTGPPQGALPSSAIRFMSDNKVGLAKMVVDTLKANPVYASQNSVTLEGATAAAPNTTTPAGSTFSPSMSTLQSQYTRQQSEYTSLVAGAQSARDAASLQTAVASITAKNREIQATLDQMMSVVAQTQGSSATLEANRQALAKRIQEINDDYNNLRSGNDTFETLKRIRIYEESKTDTKVQLYIFAFIASLVLLVLVIAAVSYFKKPATIPTPIMSPATPSLM